MPDAGIILSRLSAQIHGLRPRRRGIPEHEWIEIVAAVRALGRECRVGLAVLELVQWEMKEESDSFRIVKADLLAAASKEVVRRRVPRSVLRPPGRLSRLVLVTITEFLTRPPCRTCGGEGGDCCSHRGYKPFSRERRAGLLGVTRATWRRHFDATHLELLRRLESVYETACRRLQENLDA